MWASFMERTNSASICSEIRSNGMFDSLFNEWSRKCKRFLQRTQLEGFVGVRIRYLPSSRRECFFGALNGSNAKFWKREIADYDTCNATTNETAKLEDWLNDVRTFASESVARFDGVVYDIAVLDTDGFKFFSVSNPRRSSKTVCFVQWLESQCEPDG